MKGKIAIVTGANTGIGKATAEGLARDGATVVMACRDTAKGLAAADEIRASNLEADLQVMRLNLASLDSVRSFVAEFGSRHSRLDVLIENAGVWTRTRQLSANGYELVFAVNHLGHFLLANLLLPELKAAAPSRVVIVSSRIHKSAKLDLDDPNLEKSWSMLASYKRSKLANILFMRELAKRLEGTGVTANALHPGIIGTDFARIFPAPLLFLSKLFFKTPANGALTSLHLATAPKLACVSGRYFADCKEAQPGAAALDDYAAARLWDLSEKMIADAAL